MEFHRGVHYSIGHILNRLDRTVTAIDLWRIVKEHGLTRADLTDLIHTWIT